MVAIISGSGLGLNLGSMAALRSVGACGQMGSAPLGGNGEAAAGRKQADVGTSGGLAGHAYNVNNQVAKTIQHALPVSRSGSAYGNGYPVALSSRLKIR